MKLAVNKKYLKVSGDQILRSAGYGFIRDGRTGKESYVRRLASDHYPRLHMYYYDKSDRLEFNLHLDQKRASYEGQNAHSGEYDGPIVEEEIARLKSIIRSLAVRN